MHLEALEARHLLTTVVNTLQDVTDGSIVDGTVSLRDALALAPGGDTIRFDNSLDFSSPILLDPALGELVVPRTLTIQGPNNATLTIDAQGQSRALNITPTGGMVRIEGVTLTNGSSVASGGAIKSEGADIELVRSRVSNSFADNAGGGIDTPGTVTLSYSTVADNEARYSAGGIRAGEEVFINQSTVTGNTAGGRGGGVDASIAVHVSQSTISDNTASGSGGGINTFGYVDVADSTLSGNTTSMDGGAIYSYGEVMVNASSFRMNTAVASGGGVYARSPVTINSSLFRYNSAQQNGGAIRSESTVELNSSTLSINGSRYGGGISAAGGSANYSTIFMNAGAVRGGGIDSGPMGFSLNGTIVARNTGGVDFNDLNGELIVPSNSFIGTNHFVDGGVLNLTASPNTPDANGNLIGGSSPILADLGPLQDNGGPTHTHAPEPGSRVIDAIDPGAVASAPLFDQRNAPFLRFAGDGGRMDIGAFEVQTLSAESFVVSSLEDTIDGDVSAGDVSLREAISAANGNEGVDTITFDEVGLFATAQTLLLSDALQITEPVNIEGPGADILTIDARDRSGIFRIDAEESSTDGSTISGLTLTGGYAPSGGAVYSTNDLTVHQSVITGNRTHPNVGVNDLGSGGGIHVKRYANLTVTQSTISDNSAASFGGGILAAYASISLSTISNNTASSGGGIEGDSTYLDFSTVDGNTADVRGGGIAATERAQITNSTVSNNHAGDRGGGVYGVNYISVSNSTISGNRSDARGGGIHVYGNILRLSYSTVTDNSAGVRDGGGGVFMLNYFGIAPDQFLLGSIVAGNEYVDGNSGMMVAADDLSANYLVSNYSFIGTNSGTNLAPSPSATIPDATGNLVGGPASYMGSADMSIDPMLGPLADNGGPTLTHSLISGSPAIDTGHPTNSQAPNYDQRGYARVVGQRIDMGAVEREFNSGWHNFASPYDINDDGYIVAQDALYAINELTFRNYSDPTNGLLTLDATPPPFLDVTNDGYLSPRDALLVINQLPTIGGLPPAAPAIIITSPSRIHDAGPTVLAEDMAVLELEEMDSDDEFPAGVAWLPLEAILHSQRERSSRGTTNPAVVDMLMASDDS